MTPTRAICNALAAFVIAAPVLAQGGATPPRDDQTAPAPASAPAGPQFLKGPEVEDRRTPGVPSLLGEATSPRDRVRMRPEQFLRLVRTLREDTVPVDLRLTEAQQKSIAEAESQFTRARREYMVEHMEEIQALRQATGNAPGQARDGAMAPAGPDREALLQKLRELQEAAPSFDETQVRIWGMLTPAQQARLEPEFQRLADEMIERRAMQRLEALRTERGADDAALPAGALSDETIEKVREALRAPTTAAERGLTARDRINRRIDALPESLVTPEQKERIRERVLERLDSPGRQQPPRPAA